MHSLSRRRFVALSAAAAAGATWFDAAAHPGCREPGRRQGSVRRLAGGRAELFAAELQYRGSDPPFAGDGRALRRVLRQAPRPQSQRRARSPRCKAARRRPASSSAGHGVHGFSKDHEANKRLFDFAKKIGVKVITADPHAGLVRQPRQARGRIRHPHRHPQPRPEPPLRQARQRDRRRSPGTTSGSGPASIAGTTSAAARTRSSAC